MRSCCDKYVQTALATVVLLSTIALGSDSAIDDEVAALLNDTQPLVDVMIRHAFQSYVNEAFPMDEVKPISGGGRDTLGSYALTLIDSLDLLAICGMHDEFRRYAKWVQDRVHFDIDKHVSVFETSIRILGGLLSAHFCYEEGIVEVDPSVDDYDGGLLRLAVDLADRLLPAFSTPTGIPYGSINLRKGVSSDEVDITSTAGGGTFLLEMTIISAVTRKPKYELAARRALLSLVKHRNSVTNLVGNHINISSGQWTLDLSSVGSGVDSMMEYLIKGYAMTGDPQLYKSYQVLHDAFAKYTRKGPWFIETTTAGQMVFPLHNSLAAFYPGNLALSGRWLDEAVETCFSTHFILKKNGGIPEGYHLNANSIQTGQTGYPLRPEHVESLYQLYRTTNDVTFLKMGREFALMLWTRTATRCGFSALTDCTMPPHDSKFADAMESFVLAETLKYLYLLFHPENPVNRAGIPSRDGVDSARMGSRETTPMWVFNTEGHPLPVKDEWRWWRLHAERRLQSRGGSATATATGNSNNNKNAPSLFERLARGIATTPWQRAVKEAEEQRRALSEGLYDEYSPWNDVVPCEEGDLLCVSDAFLFPQSTASHERRAEGMSSPNGAAVHRVTDTIERRDSSFGCVNRQPLSDLDKLPKSIFRREFAV